MNTRSPERHDMTDLDPETVYPLPPSPAWQAYQPTRITTVAPYVGVLVTTLIVGPLTGSAALTLLADVLVFAAICAPSWLRGRRERAEQDAALAAWRVEADRIIAHNNVIVDRTVAKFDEIVARIREGL
jgi:hypothetical protein